MRPEPENNLPARMEPSDRRRLPPLLRRAWYGLNQAFRRRILHLEMTPDQFTVLRSLLEGDRRGMTQSELTQVMSSDPNTVASLVERMENAGWIDRKTHERDRRAHRIRVRSRGKKKFLQAREIAIALQTDVLAVLPIEDQDRFLEQLAKVADACRTAAGDVSRPGRNLTNGNRQG